MILKVILFLVFLTGIIVSIVLYTKKVSLFPLEERKKANSLLWQTNFKSKFDWIIFTLAFIAYIFLLFVYKLESLAHIVLYTSLWLVLAQTIFRNRRTLLKAGFSYEQANMDFNIAFFMFMSFSAMLILLFYQI